MKSLRPKQISDAIVSDVLVRVLPAIFKKAGLTITDIALTDSGLFSFRIKEFSPRLHFDYDGLFIEMVVSHNRQLVDYLPVAAVPLVATGKDRYYPRWSEKKLFGAACDSVEQLMHRYLQRQINRWIRTITPETSIHIYKSTELTMARLVNHLHPALAGNEPYYVGKIEIRA